jgi:hypothetical protein
VRHHGLERGTLQSRPGTADEGFEIQASKSVKTLGPEIASGLLRLQIKHQLEWTLSSPQGLMIIARHSGHYVQQDDPGLAVQAIRHVLAVATSGK